MINGCMQALDALEAKLNAKTIHELRQIARQVGVAHPTEGKKERILNEILSIGRGETAPVERNMVGAPPKSEGYDAQLVEEILACRQLCFAETSKSGERAILTVSASTVAEEYEVCGIFGTEGGNGIIFIAGEKDYSSRVYVNASFVKKYNLRRGDMVCGIAKRRNSHEYGGIISVTYVNGNAPEKNASDKNFERLTPVYPEKKLNLSRKGCAVGAMLDVFAPVGLGQRTLITVPYGVESDVLVKELALGAAQNGQKCKVIFLMTDARPEDCEYYKSALTGVEVIACSTDCGAEANALTAELALEYAKRLTELGNDAVLIVYNLTAYARAINRDGSNVSNALELSALDGVKKFVSSARNTAEGGTLTVIAAASCGGNALDDAIYNNIKDVFNSHIVLSSELAQRQIEPPLDVLASGNVRANMLLTEAELETAKILRAKSAEELNALFTENSVDELCARYKKN